jgi:tetratricopeptide (TPR) repeat protein
MLPVDTATQSSSSAAWYSLRGRVRYGLSDTNGALADLKTALDNYGAYRKDMQELIVNAERAPRDQVSQEQVNTLRLFFTLPDQGIMQAYISHAVILYRTGRYAEALEDYNEYASEEAKEPKLQNASAEKLGELIKKHLANSLGQGSGVLPLHPN